MDTDKRRIIIISCCILLTAAACVLLFMLLRGNPKQRVEVAFKATYGMDNLNDTLITGDRIDFDKLIHTFLSKGGNLSFSEERTYPDERQFYNRVKKYTVDIKKDNASELFELKTDKKYVGSFEYTNSKNASYSLLFKPDGSSYDKEFESFHLIGDKDYTYYTYDNLNTGFRIKNSNIIKNYNNSLFAENSFRIDDSFDFNLDYFSEKPITLNNINNDIDSSKGLLDTFVAAVTEAEVHSEGKCIINTEDKNVKCDHYRIVIPQKNVRKLLGMLDEDTDKRNENYQYPRALYRYFINTRYESLLRKLDDIYGISSYVKNDLKIDVYIKNSRVIRMEGSYFIDCDDKLYNIDFQMDNKGTGNVLDIIEINVNTDFAGERTTYNITREKKSDKDELSDIIEYYCKSEKDDIHTDYSNKSIITTRNNLEVNYHTKSDTFDFIVNYNDNREYINENYVYPSYTDNISTTVYKYIGSGYLEDSSDNLRIVIDKCNIKNSVTYQPDNDQKSNEYAYDYNMELSFSPVGDSYEKEEITDYNDAFTITDSEYRKLLEDNLTDEPGHTLRAQIYRIYYERDTEAVKKLLCEPVFECYKNNIRGETDGYQNSYLEITPLDGKNSIMAQYSEDRIPSFFYKGSTLSYDVNLGRAVNKYNINLTRRINNALEQNNTGPIKLYNIGYYKNYLKNMEGYENVNSNDQLYYYIVPYYSGTAINPDYTKVEIFLNYDIENSGNGVSLGYKDESNY